ncbi:probable aquaporin NIP-type [Impatiens glandulifera]|uniref:probable aquaporin NIP-type n=1 Tax=Impatiens glandulifera TaxID=253017 RepID=UPI001FB0EADF|nr:probable aquaporin NIP-type [Impatiens glandulifera]
MANDHDEGIKEESQHVSLDLEEDNYTHKSNVLCSSSAVISTAQKMVAELIGTYFVIFSGCGSVVVNNLYDGTVTFPGICLTWGLIVMVMIYTLGHVSGAHFNPAVTIASATFRRFPWKEVPFYIVAQLLGAVLASGTLNLIFDISESKDFFGTVPVGTDIQSFVLEVVTSFLLMFVVTALSTDNRAIGELGGMAVGMTITINVFVAGPISGASMNPARSLGPAFVKNIYKGIWVYILGPPIGTILGAFIYKFLRFET